MKKSYKATESNVVTYAEFVFSRSHVKCSQHLNGIICKYITDFRRSSSCFLVPLLDKLRLSSSFLRSTTRRSVNGVPSISKLSSIFSASFFLCACPSTGPHD